ncbi:MAG: M28 family peptidase [Vicinamibacteria bacterium]|nr:M28 family peptidase [Vicinamibacteria bacterium]
MICALILAAATINADAALGHARRLSALGPHPWGSTLNSAAAEYIASQFREVGLEGVRLQRFESHGVLGANVVGVLRSSDVGFILIGAHHDTAPGSPGAYDDGGGVGVLIEAARALAKRTSRPRTLVFVSFDGEEAWATTQSSTVGSRAYIAAMGSRRANMVGAVILEMCGWAGGKPCVHPIAYADPLRPGRSLVAPGWLIGTALAGAREAGAELHLGDPWLPWIYQPAVRCFRLALYGDDLSFIQSALPAVLLSDSSMTSFYPWYHSSADTADKLDAEALERMGRAALGVISKLMSAPRGPVRDEVWYAGGSTIVGGATLAVIAALTLMPGLWMSLFRGRFAFLARSCHAVVFGVLYWRHPIPTLWILALPNLILPFKRGLVTMLIALGPALGLAFLGAYAWRRGAVSGTWFAPWEWPLLVVALGLASFLPRPRKTSGRRGRRAARRGLPR